MYLVASPNATVSGCEVTGNTAASLQSDGGGIYCDSSVLTLIDSIISGNSCGVEHLPAGNTGRGGGILVNKGSAAIISNCLISNNTGEGGEGGGVAAYYSTTALTDCVISGNDAAFGGGAYAAGVQALSLTSSVVCGNSADQLVGCTVEAGNCMAFSCDDSNGTGMPDECDGDSTPTVHAVPADYPTIQAAIEAAATGDTVLVGPGTWTGTSDDWVINPGGKPITIRSSHGPEITILDGQDQRTVIRCVTAETTETVIDGFTITGGYAAEGGGLYCNNDGSPTLNNCTITGNRAVDDSGGRGGGIYCAGSGPVLNDCTISNNSAGGNGQGYGGGIYSIYLSYPTLNGCNLSGNFAKSAGGGVYSVSSFISLNDCLLANNTAALGGGLYGRDDFPLLERCTIQGNVANMGGGIYCFDGSWGRYTDCLIQSNTASGYGGGVQCNSYCQPQLVTCQIIGNSAGSGGGIYSIDSIPYLAECFVSTNTAASGGGIYAESSGGVFPSLTNSEVCGNSGHQIEGSFTDGGGNTIADDCPPGSPCDGDVNLDGTVNIRDLLLLLENWAGWGDGDVDGDSVVDLVDLELLLSGWGPCE